MYNEQKEVSELIGPISDALNKYLINNFVNDLKKKTGISHPTILSLRKGDTTHNISLKMLVNIANAIGYKIDKLEISKIEQL